MKSSTRFVALALVLAAAAACGKKDDGKKAGGGGDGGAPKPAESGPGNDGGPKASEPYDKTKATGSVKGVVKFKGTRPGQKVNGQGASTDNFCKAVGDQTLEAVEVNEDLTLPHVLVFASKGPHEGKTGFEPQTVVIDQQGCTYVPHVTAVMVGQDFTVKTSDNTTHNVKASPKRQNGFNLMQPPGKSDTVSFKSKEAAIKLQCDVHSWMSAWIFALEHPLYTTSSATGTFEIKGLLPGTYTFKAWHETFANDKGGKDVSVEIKDGQTTEIVIELGQ